MNQQLPPSNETPKNEDISSDLDELTALKEKLKEERDKANDYLNQLKYLQADFENYKKRVNKEIMEHIRYGNRQLIHELLPILDELEHAIDAGGRSTKKALQEGVMMTYNKLCKVLQGEGLSKIETVEKPFDPNKHEAVEQVPMEGNDGIVVEEIQKGYMLQDMVLRPSLVKVAVDTSKKVEEHE